MLQIAGLETPEIPVKAEGEETLMLKPVIVLNTLPIESTERVSQNVLEQPPNKPLLTVKQRLYEPMVE